MADLSIFRSAPITLEGNGGVVAGGAVVLVDDANFSDVTGNQEFPWGELVLAATFATAPVAGEIINLYRRDLNIDGTNHAQVPSSNYPHKYAGSFIVDGVTTLQAIKLDQVGLSKECEFYIENQTGQPITAGWTLTLTPWTYSNG